MNTVLEPETLQAKTEEKKNGEEDSLCVHR